MKPTLNISGRILYLTDDPQQLQRQLRGENLDQQSAGPLRDNVSTDEITPVDVLLHFDERLGRVPYVGVRSGGQKLIEADSIRNGGFSVTVAGKRYGKGSSREHSPMAEYEGGIRLVIAESFERIYRQNADNIGLFTSTDFGLIERIERGERITLDELLADRDPLAASILRAGGLLRFGQKEMKSLDRAMSSVPPSELLAPMSYIEKVLWRHVVYLPDKPRPVAGEGAFVRTNWRFLHEYFSGMCAHLLKKHLGDDVTLMDTDHTILFADHLSFAEVSPAHQTEAARSGVSAMKFAHHAFAKRFGLREHGYLDGSLGSEGISHPMMTERYALPGQMIAGTDSHTPHSGAVGCAAFGVGTTDMANALVTGAVRLTIPKVIRVEFTGKRPLDITAKDLVLYLLANERIRAGAGVGKAFEFTGEVVRSLDTDERATLTNMTAELGGLTGIVQPDEETVRFLRERRNVDFKLESWMQADPGATYSETVSMDCTNLSPMIARPGDPGNGVMLSSLAQRQSIDIAYGGSCTGGKRADFDAYYEVLKWAKDHEVKLPAGVKLFLQYGTADVKKYCEAQSYLEVFSSAGAMMLEPSCGACANCGPGASDSTDQVTISAVNRNFPGRSGPGSVWLASPATVVASALAGKLSSFAELKASHGSAG